MPQEIMFVHSQVSIADVNLCLGPFEKDDGPLYTFNKKHTTIAHLLHMGGCFKSITDARKNGWNKPIPKGYTQFSFGKGRLMVYILNEYPNEEEKEMIDGKNGGPEPHPIEEPDEDPQPEPLGEKNDNRR